jgi:hypothetical protein
MRMERSGYIPVLAILVISWAATTSWLIIEEVSSVGVLCSISKSAIHREDVSGGIKSQLSPSSTRNSRCPVQYRSAAETGWHAMALMQLASLCCSVALSSKVDVQYTNISPSWLPVMRLRNTCSYSSSITNTYLCDECALTVTPTGPGRK